MSLLLMVLALLGAVAVLSLGTWVMGRLQQAAGPVDPAGPAPAAEEGEPANGGYFLLSGADPAVADQHSSAIPAATLTRVRELLALGRGTEAARTLRQDTGMDLDHARAAIDRIRSGEIS